MLDIDTRHQNYPLFNRSRNWSKLFNILVNPSYIFSLLDLLLAKEKKIVKEIYQFYDFHPKIISTWDGGGLWNSQCVVSLPCRCYMYITKRWSHERSKFAVYFRNKLVTTWRVICYIVKKNFSFFSSHFFFLQRLKLFAHVKH